MQHQFNEQELLEFFASLQHMTDAEVLVALYKAEAKHEFAFALAALSEANHRGIHQGVMQ
jgi:hypothetical protein